MHPNDEQPQSTQPHPPYAQPSPPGSGQPYPQGPAQGPSQSYGPAYAPPPGPSHGSGEWGSPAPRGGAPTASVRRARPWRVALVAFLTLLVLIAGLGNQWVTEQLNKHTRSTSFGDLLLRSDNVYAWRFAKRYSGPDNHIWIAAVASVLVALVLTAIFVAIICRGSGGFWQAFVGSWLSVLGATVVAGYVRVAITDNDLGSRYSKATQVFFSSESPETVTLVAAICFGFVVAIAAGIAAVASRHTEAVPADGGTLPDDLRPWAPRPEQPDGERYPSDPQYRGQSEQWEPAAQHTAVLPSQPPRDAPQHETQELPREVRDDPDAPPRSEQ